MIKEIFTDYLAEEEDRKNTIFPHISVSVDKLNTDLRLEVERLGIYDRDSIIGNIKYELGGFGGSDGAMASVQFKKANYQKLRCIFYLDQIARETNKATEKLGIGTHPELVCEYLRGLVVSCWLHERQHLIDIINPDTRDTFTQSMTDMVSKRRNTRMVANTALAIGSLAYYSKNNFSDLSVELMFPATVLLAGEVIKRLSTKLTYLNSSHELEARRAVHTTMLHVNPFDIGFVK